MRFIRPNHSQSPIIDASEPVAIGAVAERTCPKIIPRITHNSVGENNPNSMQNKIKRQYEKFHTIREQILDGFTELNPKEYFKNLARTKPEAALNFLGKIMPRDLDITQERGERMPIIIVQAQNAQVNMQS